MAKLKTKAIVVASGGAVLAALFGGPGTTVGTHTVARQVGHSLTAKQWRLMSGTSQQALLSLGVHTVLADTPQSNGVDLGGGQEGDGTAAGTTVGGAISPSGGTASGSAIFPNGEGSCASHSGSNVRVNTACTNYADAALHGRSMAQNETAIAVSPTNPRNLVASSNDYMRGDGNCGAYYSTSGGENWNGTTAPLLFVRGSSLTPPSGNARQYWQAGGDTSVAFNSKGTAFLSCQVFNRGAGVTQDPDLSSGLLVFRSANGGGSWDFPGRVAVSSYEPNNTLPNGVVLHDKQLMTIDNHKGSPFQDRIYLTWTEFDTDGTAFIRSVHSSDGGETWSKSVVVSSNSSLCPISATSTAGGVCDSNQFSDPFVAADGSLYVAWANYNNAVTGNDNRNQMLLAKSTDGGATFSAPVKVADYYDLPDCVTYTGQDPGRACVTDKGATQNSFYRATNYPSGVADPTNPNHVIVNFGSYLSKNSNETTNCVPQGFAADGNNKFTGATTLGACNNQILQSESTNAGATFTGTTTDPRNLPVASRQKTVADAFWQWTGITAGGHVVVGYYDRQYGTDETSGASDYSVAFGHSARRVTTVSSPPPTEFGGLFNGDYNILAVAGDKAYVTWTDTRNPGVTSCPGNVDAICALGNDEDDYMAAVELGD